MKPRHLNSLGLTARSSSLLGLCTISFCVFSAGHALAQATWDGGGTADGFGNYNWADGPNWLADSAPVSGNSLTFSGTVNTTTSFNNIAADTSYAGITFDNTAGAFTLSGNRITLDGNVVNNDTDLQTLNLDLLMSATRTFDTASGNILVGGIVSGTGSAGLTKIGANTLTFANVNTYTGNTLVQNGTLVLRGGADNRLATSSSVVVGSTGFTGILQLGDSAGATNQTLVGLTRSVTNTSAVVGGHTSISTLTINNSSNVTFDGVLGGAGVNQNNLALTKTGTGNFTLTAGGSYTGPTLIQNGGIAVVAGDNRIGATSAVTLGDSTANTSGILVIGNTGSARSQTVSSLTAVGTGTENRVVGAHGTNNSTLTVNNSATVTYDGFLGGTGTNQNNLNLNKSGSGTLVLTQANTYVGSTTINAGVLRAGNDNSFGSIGGITLANTNTTLELANGITINRGLLILQAGDKKTLTLQNGATSAEYSGAITINESTHGNVEVSVGNAGTLTISGAVGSSQPGGLTKTGAGTLILSSGSNTYTGNTTISGGTLIVSGNISTSSLTTVAVDATLGGTGTIGKSVINGTLAVGNSPGQMNFTDTLSLNGTVVMEIDGTVGAGVAGGHDFINLTGVGAAGALTYGGAMTLDIGTIFGVGTYSWDLLDMASETGTYATVTLANQYSGSLLDDDANGIWDLTSGNNTWQFTQSTGVLGLTVIPEPATALLGGLGLLTLLRRRRA